MLNDLTSTDIVVIATALYEYGNFMQRHYRRAKAADAPSEMEWAVAGLTRINTVLPKLGQYPPIRIED